jgi:hypothetical protein
MGKIIAINGRVSGGKDTVGKIIQELTKKKDYRIIEDEFGNPERDGRGNYVTYPDIITWQVRKFAAKLKIIAGILLGDPHFVEDWEKGGKEYRNEHLPEWGMTRREFLLKLGTESLRDNFHRDVHVISAFSDYTDDQNWLITDLRFPNEFNGSEDRGAITLRVNRHFSNIYPEQWGRFCKAVSTNHTEIRFIEWLRYNDEDLFKIVSHPSETSLGLHKFKYELDNNGTLETLIEQVKSILKAENII